MNGWLFAVRAGSIVVSVAVLAACSAATPAAPSPPSVTLAATAAARTSAPVATSAVREVSPTLSVPAATAPPPADAETATASVVEPTTGAPAAVAPSSAPELDVLRQLSVVALVPPEGLAPFAGLPIREVNPRSTDYFLYSIFYGRSDVGADGADIWGFKGAGRFEGMSPESSGCEPGAAYCTKPGSGDPTGPPAVEVFYGLHVGRWPARIAHVASPSTGPSNSVWMATWYDQEADATYEIQLRNGMAAPYGTTISDSNLSGAEALAQLANQLVPLR